MSKRNTHSRVSPSIDLPLFAGEHLFYEAQMFVTARTALQRTVPGTFPMNAMIELCVLHFRNLVDFFYLPRRKSDDVVAADYVAGWQSQHPAMTPPLGDARERANTELAHLTAKRIVGTPPEKARDFSLLSGELRPVIATFVRVADPLKVPQRTLSELQKI